jgi:hypothetical protein
MAIKQQIVIEVDDKGAIKSVDGLTNALDDNTKAVNENANATKQAEVDSEAYAASLEKQEQRIKLLDGAINVVGGSIETLTGALVLSGAVSEEQAERFESAALGAIALADGTKRTFDGVKSLSEGLKAYGGVAGLAQKAQAALNTTVLANPYVAAAVAIAALGAAIYLFTRQTDEAAQFQKEFDSAMNEAIGTTVAQTQALETYNSIVQDSTRPLEERQYALEELNKQGVATEDIDLSNAESLQLLNERTAQAIPLIMARAKASAAASILEEALKKQLEAQNSSLEDNLTWYQETWSFIKGSVVPGGYALQSTLDAVKNQSEAVAEATANVNRAQTSYQATLDELVKLEGQNVTVQKTVRENLERRAKTDESVKQALIDRANAEKEAIAIYEDVKKQQELLQQEGIDRELLAIDQSYEDRLAKLTTYYGAESEAVKALQEVIESEKQAVRDKYSDEDEAKEKEKAEKLKTLKEEIANAEAVTEEEKFQRQLEITAQYYDDLIEQARQAGLDTVELEKAKNEALDAEQDAQNQQSLDKQKAYRDQLTQLAVDSALSLIGDLKSLNQLYDKDNEAAAKKAFNREKALSIVETVLSTYLSASKAYASQLIPGDPTSIIRAQIAAGVAIAGGLARLAVIKSQKFQPSGASGGGGGGGGAAAGGAGGAGGAQVTTPQQGNSTTGLFGGVAQPPATTFPTQQGETAQQPQFGPIQTYVLAGDVTSAQEANAKINGLRKL